MAQTVHPAVVCMLSPPVAMPTDGEGQDLPVPQLVMLANVALTSEAGGCDYMAEEKQMVELKTVGSCGYSDSEDEGLPCYGYEGHPGLTTAFHPESPQVVRRVVEEEEEPNVASGSAPEVQTEQAPPSAPEPDHTPAGSKRKRGQGSADDSRKKKPFHCKPCQYQAECEEEFAHHIRVHSTKKLIAVSWAEGEEQAKESPGAAPANGEAAANGKGVIRCERCGYNTNRYDHYVSHLKHHGKEGENQRVYKCTICTYTTVSQYHWKKHLRNHFPSKLYTCSQCCYFSDRKNNYVQHIRTHTGERPFQCPYCQYTSSQKTHLTRHMRTHSGEKPFKCDNCSYVAANQHEVTRHARQVHGGPKPLSCPHCQYKTADRSNYKKHVELHVNPRQFLCPVCSYAASKKCNLQYHIKSRHPGCSDITMDVSKVKLRVKNTGSTVAGAAKPTQHALAGNGQREPPQPAGQEKKTACGGDAEEQGQVDASPINLSTKRTSRPVESRPTNTDRKEEASLKKGEESAEVESTNKAHRGSEKCPGVEESTEKGKTQAVEEKCERKERGSVKAMKSAEKGGGVEKQAEACTDKVEKAKDQEEEGTRNLKKPSGKTRPKRERKARTSNAGVEGEEKEAVKEDGNAGRTVRSAAKRPGRAAKNTEKTDKEQAPETQEPPAKVQKKEVKTKAEKRKSYAKESSPPEEPISDQPTSRTRTKSKRVEGGAEHPDQTSVLQSAGKLPKGRRTSNCKDKQSKSAVEPDNVELKAKTKKTKRTHQSSGEAETTNESKEQSTVEDTVPQEDDCPIKDVQPAVVEEKDPEVSVEMTSQPQVSESSETLAKVDSVEKQPENATVPPEPLKATAGTTPMVDGTATKQVEGSSEPKDIPESSSSSSSSSKEACPPPEMVPEPKEKGQKQAEGKKPLPPLELPKVGDKPTDTEEDEGIHSPDGSDISDSVSEGSDDSGLNGLAGGSASAPEVLTEPDTPSEESPAPAEKTSAPTVESPTPTKLQGHTCIFCDRTFPMEVEYRRHLNRHLVNVYYLEDAVREER